MEPPVVPGFFLVKDNVRSHVQRLWRQVLKVEEFVTTDWTPSSPDLNPTEHFCEIMFPSYAPQIAQEVRSRRTSPRAPSVISLGARPDVVRLLPSKPLSCCVVAVHNFFAFIFRVSLNSALCRVLARM